MSLLTVNNLSHSFGDKILYTNSSFELFNGEHMGLVGQNGTGKTTLLNSLIGEVIPDRGEIRWQKGVYLGYLDQHARIDGDITVFDYLRTAFDRLFKIEEELNQLYICIGETYDESISNKISDYQSLLETSGFYEIDSTVMKVSEGLGITSFGMDSEMGTLSGGQRAKVILAKLLLEKPNVLLLDEPTNFLDRAHIDWLSDYLKAFEGAFIVISHDFDFLDCITTCICDIEFATIRKYSGNFSRFLELKGAKRESYIREYAAQQKTIKKYEDYISKNKVRASTANMAKSRQKQLDKIDRMPPPKSTPKPDFHFKSLPITPDRTLFVEGLLVGYDGKPLLPKLSFTIESGQKVAVTGFNGIGKSTLLKTLLGKIPCISGTFSFANSVKSAYYEQELRWENADSTPLEIIKDKFPSMSDKQVRSKLAQCGIKSESVNRPVYTLSGGEQSKTKLCILMLTPSNLLILDEPTNHLDVDSKKVLKDQLEKWEGSVIIVSHEKSFHKGWTDKVINIEKYLKNK